MKLLNLHENLIIVKTFSKSHGMAGLRFSCVFGCEKIITYLQKTGVENAVSAVSIAYFNYLLNNRERIKRIINDINIIKKQLVEYIKNLFPTWDVYTTDTHFLTIDTKEEIIAASITEVFQKNKIAIKHLGTISKLSTYIRFTIPELKHISKLKDVFVDFKKESVHA